MQTVGEYLEQKRAKKKLSVEDISKITRIHPRYIEAIDVNDFSIFSSEAYVKGFIIAYAKALEETPADILKLYYTTIGGEPPKKNIVSEEANSEEITHYGNFFFSSRIVIPVIILIIAVIIFFNVFFTKEEVASKGDNIEENANVSDTTITVKTESNIGKQDFSETNILQIKAIEDTWLKVTADSLKPEEMILRTGETKTLTSKDRFVLSVGNAGGIKVKFNNDVYDSLGRRGQVIKNMVFKSEKE